MPVGAHAGERAFPRLGGGAVGGGEERDWRSGLKVHVADGTDTSENEHIKNKAHLPGVSELCSLPRLSTALAVSPIGSFIVCLLKEDHRKSGC